MKKFLKLTSIIVGTVIGAVIFILIYFTLNVYAPDKELKLQNLSKSDKSAGILPGRLKLISWNIGYCGLDKDMDFIMEGGKMGVPESKDQVEKNLNEVIDFLKKNQADIYFIQEVDKSSSRSFDINQLNEITASFPEYHSWYSINFKVKYVPSPISDPIGRVNSGILTISRWDSPSAVRFQLPGDYPWPTKIFHLKRCITLVRFDSPVKGKDWCLVNLHLSAYDTGGNLRKQQLDFVKELMLKLYNEGNYVIMGGDWNSLFPGVSMDMFGKYTTSKESLFWVNDIKAGWTPEKWEWAIDKRVPSCRTLEKPYVKGDNFTTVIDGFLLSPNVKLIEAKGIGLGFKNSDHNPVMITVKIR